VSTPIVFLVVDGLIILSFRARLYKDALKDVIADSFVLLYLLFAFGLCYFAMSPAPDDDRLRTAALRGALYGLCTYATYSLT
jgi:uncharacterized membrane protein